ncbi:MAG TPA: ATP-dependent DNA helicase RecG, partial [Saprospiraceae bacterium]|nr:ATP-dependent DNA helicase RecG [Saprospiraceae bacterium]
TNNGFEIADADLKLRGPGDIQGTQQSGFLDFKLLNISSDRPIMDAARNIAIMIIDDDPNLSKPENESISKQVSVLRRKNKDWGRVS